VESVLYSQQANNTAILSGKGRLNLLINAMLGSITDLCVARELALRGKLREPTVAKEMLA